MIDESVENTIIPSKSKETKKKKGSNDCKEYQALKYKTMITTGTSFEKKIDNETNEQQLYNFLDNEIMINKKQSWSKLTKTEKIKKVKYYLDNKGKTTFSLTDEEVMNARRFILTLLDRKKMTKNNEIEYDEDSGEILSINIIEFNFEKRKFTLNKSMKNKSSKKTAKNKST